MSIKRLLPLLLLLAVLAAACRQTPTPTPTLTPTTEQPVATATAAPTATPGLLPADPNATVAPVLVARRPAAAEALTLDGPFELVFDQPMDAAQTAAAVQVVDAGGAPVAGEVSFPQPRVLRFQPAGRLAAGATYRLLLDESAASALGANLTAGLTLDFATIGPLEVSSLIPADGTTNVAALGVVTVLFNRPVVPLMSAAETAALASPIAIEPPVAGSGQWVNTSVYVFRPDAALVGGQSYTVRVLADAVNALSATGAQLADDVTATFSVQPVQIVTFGLAFERDGYQDAPNGYRDLPLNAALRLFFDQPMATDTTEAAIALASADGAAVPLTFRWDASFMTATFTPTELLALNTDYVLTVADTATAATGGSLGEPLTWRARTVRPPSITGTDPADGATAGGFDDRFVVSFAAPMDVESLRGRVTFDPPLREDADTDGFYSDWDWTLRFYGLQPSTDYTVTIDPGMTDPYGNPIVTGETVRFRSGPAAPLLRFNLPQAGYWGSELALYRQGGPSTFWLTQRNLTQFDVSLFTLPFETFIAQQEAGTLYRWRDAAQLLRSESVTPQAEADRASNIRFELQDTAGSALPLGLYYIGANSPQVESFTDGPWDISVPLAIVNSNLTLKTTATEVLVWLTDLDSGAPLADVPVRLLDPTGNELLRASTDADGLIYRDDVRLDVENYEAYYAVTDDPAVYGFAVSTWSDGLEPWLFNISTGYYQAPDMPVVAVYTDRPLYRPGQTVGFKGIVRLDDDLRYTVPAGRSVQVAINALDEQLFSEEFTLSPYGTFAGEFRLADEATLGDYQITVMPLPGESPSGYASFGVAEYRKPTFAVNVTTSAADYLAPQTDGVPVTVDAQFFSGGAVVNGEVQWYARGRDYSFDPGRAWQSFSFSNLIIDGDYYFGFDYQPDSDLGSGSGTTDERGQYRFDLPVVLAAEQASQVISIEATVNDVGGNAVSGRTDAILHSADRYVGVRSDAYIGIAGQPTTIELATVDWDGNAVAGSELTLIVYSREWLSVQEEDEFGNTIWRSTVRETAVLTQTDLTTGADGMVSTDFVPASGGEYRLAGRYVQGAQFSAASAYLWVAGVDFIPWRQTNDNTFDLVADSDDYQPGDTAQILIASPFQGPATALVTVERGHIKQVERLDLTANSTIYELPITADMAPNVFVSVLVVKGIDAFNNTPRYRVGMVELTVARDAQQLTVTISSDLAQYGPGDTAEFEIRVTDASGQPVQAELSLALSDLAALSLAPRRDPALLDVFYGNRWLSVQTALLLNRLVDETIAELSDEFKGGGGGGGDFGIFDVRENFQDTAYWAGQVTTDADGVARVDIALPDNLTTWRMDARAVTQATLVGEATADIQTTRPLLVAPYTPRFFIVGDRTQVGTLVHNNTDDSLTAQVTLQLTGATLDGVDGVQTVTIPARQQAAVIWPLLIDDDATRVDAVFSANAGDLQDASRPPLTTLPDGGIPVYRYTVPETVGTSGQLLSAGATVESLALPLIDEPIVGQVSVQVAPSLAAAMTEGLTWLEQYPYECTEQIVSKFLPNVVTTRALNAAGLNDPALEEALAEQVNTALQRLYTRQQSDGGWPWWEANQSPSDSLISAYVVLGLVEARESGYAVSNGVINRGVGYLRRVMTTVDGLTGRPALNRQAFIQYVLARSAPVDAGQLDALFEQREGLDLYARGYLAQALAISDAGDPRLATLIADFVAAADLSASGTHWEEQTRDAWNWNSDTRTTAILLSTLARLEPDNPLVANSVRWLMAHRVDGRWASTQDTAWTLIGLTDWMVASGELEADFLYEVALNGTRIGGGQADATTLREVATWQIDAATLSPTDLNRLAIGRDDGPGNLYYSAFMRLNLPVETLPPLDHGFSISRSYYRPDDATTPVTSAAQGETLLARLTLVVPQTRHYVIVDDWLPAGLEAIDTSLLTSSQAVQPDNYDGRDLFTRGWGWWSFSHVQLRDERVVLAADILPPGTYEYVYLVRAGTPGQYRVIPPTAQEFYFPDVSGRGAGSIFTVTP